MSRPTPKILIVDDEKTVCHSLGLALAGEGYEIDSSQSGEEALRKIEDGGYAAIICDLMMPGLSGLDVLKILRDRGRPTPVIIVTGYPTSKAAREASHMGAFDFLMKPFAPEDIRGVVRRALGAGLG
ncbi:MAG: response regulator [Candidatus Aminicenantes bacterium]|nr:response regulator [Candidatus Aminicenantes bacterium]